MSVIKVEVPVIRTKHAGTLQVEGWSDSEADVVRLAAAAAELDMSASEARELAARLIEAADTMERAASAKVA